MKTYWNEKVDNRRAQKEEHINKGKWTASFFFPPTVLLAYWVGKKFIHIFQ